MEPIIKMGTVEPIRSDSDKDHQDDVRDRLAFIRGVITKYEDSGIDAEIIQYIKGLIK